MRIRIPLLITLLTLTVACSTNHAASGSAPQVQRQYNGTASVGDFLTITIDVTGQTIAYKDVSNGDSGTVPYTVNVDGTYTLNDPSGNLIAAYEVPGYALLIQAAKTGPDNNTPALITAVESGPISMATFEGNAYNYMQFRTAAGGLEAGSFVVNSQGMGNNSSYWPYGAYNGNGSPFHVGEINTVQAQLDPSGTFLKMADGSGAYDYIFGTANGIFAVDTPNGAILGLKKAATKNFDPTFAGNYKAIYYQKTGARTGQGNIETGTPSLDNATLTVTTGGQVTIADSEGTIVNQAVLTAVADTPYLYGSTGKLSDPCYGLFTFRVTTAKSQQDVFVTFMGRAMLFSSFNANLPWGQGNTYDYLYGVALK